MGNLEDRESIKTLKALYFYHVDHKNWEGWRNEVFVPDVVWRLPEVQSEPICGIEAVINTARGALEGCVSIHHGHMPIITFPTADTATGIWAMEDLLYFSKENPYQGKYGHLHGFGHYHEEYARTPKGWRITAMQLTRLRVDLS